MSKITRREFVKVVGLSGSGLFLAAFIPSPVANILGGDKPTIFSPSVYLQIDSNGVITVIVHRTEMGQGVRTALPMIIAEELEVPIEKIKVVQADGDVKYGHQTTGGSLSVRLSFEPFRVAGATARTMLITAAALKFGVSASKCFAENGFVVNSINKKKLAYGKLVDDAAKLPVPEDVKFKDPKDYKIIGKRVHRKDSPDKIHGKTKFGIDFALPGMFYSVIKRAPVLGAKVKNFDAKEALKVKGVVEVIKVSDGVAVISNSTWSAIKGRDVLKVNWDFGKNANLSSESIRKEMESHLSEEGITLEERGKQFKDSSKEVKTLEAIYEVPFLAHAPMEPVNAVADVTGDKAELWVSSQNPQAAQKQVANILKRKPENVIIHVTFVGGAFGRKLRSDFAVEAAEISSRSGKIIKLLWTRDDDMKHGYFRPASVHNLKGTVKNGKVQEFKNHIIAPSIIGQIYGGLPKDPRQYDIGMFATGLEYKFPYTRVAGTVVNTPINVSWFRSVYGTQNPFAIESFIDELAYAAGKDPLQLRKELLPEDSRLRKVMLTAAEKAGWDKPLSKGKGRGIAIFEGFGSFIAQVAEISIKNNELKLDRFVVAVDCGIVINPDIVEAQIQGGIVFGLSAALKQEITIRNGSVEQSNYADYPMLTLNETPDIEIQIVKNFNKVGGLGEVPVPPVAPALCNAIFNATGKRIRKLPVVLG